MGSFTTATYPGLRAIVLYNHAGGSGFSAFRGSQQKFKIMGLIKETTLNT